ncbi:MAG: sortase [Candidatus Absconditabacteria bacterium]
MKQLKLNDLDQYIKKMKLKRFLVGTTGEILGFVATLAFVSIVGYGFINFQVFKQSIEDRFGYGDINNTNLESSQEEKTFTIKSLGENNIKEQTQNSISEFEKYFEDKIKDVKIKGEKEIYKKDMEKYLKTKLSKYSFNFNILPPHKRIRITSIGVDAPVADVLYKTTQDIEDANYDAELFKGVVKYPFTTNPGEVGNTLIFGHTSYYWWKKNPYGEIFSKLRKLKKGDSIELMRDGKLYEYDVEQILVKTPNRVKEVIDQYYDGQYLTLMGCYPIGTDKNRMLVVAKRKETIKLSLNK